MRLTLRVSLFDCYTVLLHYRPSGHCRRFQLPTDSPLVRKAGALAKDGIIGAGEVWKIFSDVDVELPSLTDTSSESEAVGMTGPGAVSNGVAHILGHGTGLPSVALKHWVIIERVRAIVDDERVGVKMLEGVDVMVGHPVS